MIKKILVGVAVVLLAIQFVRPIKNQAEGVSENDISVVYPAIPEDVLTMLQTKCYDCHSNNTEYPWYASIQPVAWWLADHVEEGKEHLNFAEFRTYDTKRANHKLEEVVEEVAKGEMPLDSYTLIHRDAVVTPEEKIALRSWIASLGVKVE